MKNIRRYINEHDRIRIKELIKKHKTEIKKHENKVEELYIKLREL